MKWFIKCIQGLNYLWSRISPILELLVVVGVVLLAAKWVGNSNQDDFSLYKLDSWYNKWADPIITIATLLIAVFVWVDNRISQWKISLPKRLSVHFKDGDHYVLSYYNAILLGEHDVRAFGQQLGKQMYDNNNLEFFPGLFSKTPVIIQKEDGRYVNYYEVEMQLRLVPEKFKNTYEYWIYLDKQNEMPEAEPIPDITEDTTSLDGEKKVGRDSEMRTTDIATQAKATAKRRDNEWVRRNIQRGEQNSHPLEPFKFNPRKPC